jgi:endo-beta-N-acetylglucosaminidase D
MKKIINFGFFQDNWQRFLEDQTAQAAGGTVANALKQAAANARAAEGLGKLPPDMPTEGISEAGKQVLANQEKLLEWSREVIAAQREGNSTANIVTAAAKKGMNVLKNNSSTAKIKAMVRRSSIPEGYGRSFNPLPIRKSK